MKFTVMAGTREADNKKCENFAVIRFEINRFNGFTYNCSCYDSYENAFSQAISKLPVIRDMKYATDFQLRTQLAVELLTDTDEVIVGTMKRDLGAFWNLLRSCKGFGINNGKQRIDIESPIREIVYEMPVDRTITIKSICKKFNVDIETARDLACSIFGCEYIDDLPKSALRATCFLLLKLQELGYNGEQVADVIFNKVEENNAYGDAVVDVPAALPEIMYA